MWYVLVSQGVDIFHTQDKEEAEAIMIRANHDWRAYCEKCLACGERPVDNEVFLYIED